MAFKLLEWADDWFATIFEACVLEPEWKIELQLATVELRDFVALTMGCRYDVLDEEDPLPIVCLTPKGRSAVWLETQYRLRVIGNNLEANVFPGFELNGKKYVRLKDATRWVYDHGWELPEPMMRLIDLLPKQLPATSEAPIAVSKSRKAFEYESAGLNALYDLIERYFFDANGRPIYDPEKWPLKKSLTCDSVNWSSRTLEEADTIITSGNRKGKAAK